MRWTNKRAVWIAVLAALTVAVNTLTVINLVGRFSDSSLHDLFKTPDSIILCENGKIVEINRQDGAFNTIAALNKKRADIIEQYQIAEFGNSYNTYEEGKINKNDIDAIGAMYIKYIYDGGRKIAADVNTGREEITANSVSFILTGQFSSQIYIENDSEHLTLGYLNTSAELINLVRELLNS